MQCYLSVGQFIQSFQELPTEINTSWKALQKGELEGKLELLSKDLEHIGDLYYQNGMSVMAVKIYACCLGILILLDQQGTHDLDHYHCQKRIQYPEPLSSEPLSKLQLIPFSEFPDPNKKRVSELSVMLQNLFQYIGIQYTIGQGITEDVEPPSRQFVLLGLGSIPRNEMCPYSEEEPFPKYFSAYLGSC